MKLHFEADLPYQWAAIEAVCDLFHGQEICRTEFTVTVRAARQGGADAAAQGALEGMLATEQGGIGNRLTLLNEEIEGNLRAVQLRNGLPPTTTLSPDFTVEMETGTGKTYVYLRTVFELNRRYGFTKFRLPDLDPGRCVILGNSVGTFVSEMSTGFCIVGASFSPQACHVQAISYPRRSSGCTTNRGLTEHSRT